MQNLQPLIKCTAAKRWYTGSSRDGVKVVLPTKLELPRERHFGAADGTGITGESATVVQPTKLKLVV